MNWPLTTDPADRYEEPFFDVADTPADGEPYPEPSPRSKVIGRISPDAPWGTHVEANPATCLVSAADFQQHWRTS